MEIINEHMPFRIKFLYLTVYETIYGFADSAMSRIRALCLKVSRYQLLFEMTQSTGQHSTQMDNDAMAAVP